MSASPLLRIEDLRCLFHSRERQVFVRAVDGVSLSVERGETLGVVGESGSGKSVTALSVMGLVDALPGVVSGRIELVTDAGRADLLPDLETYVRVREADGKVLEVRKDVDGWRRHLERRMGMIRGKAVTMIFQNPKSSLNPFLPVGEQISEAVRLHTPLKGKAEAAEAALAWLARVRMDSPALRFGNYPGALSGGMCQRAMIAMALAAAPSLLIADEPTTGLDATIQSRILSLLAELSADLGLTVMLISHDMGVVRRLADRIAVMYSGQVVEAGPARDVLSAGRESGHPYTAALLSSIPSERHIREKLPLAAIAGDVPDATAVPGGCRFFGRCDQVTPAIREQCEVRLPPLAPVGPRHRVRCWLRCGEKGE